MEALLGQGGMGRVYAAEDLHLRRQCALKVLQRRRTDGRAVVDRFIREAQVIATFDHEHIVKIYSFAPDPAGEVFFAMELLTGEDLEARLRDEGRRPVLWRDVCAWGVQIARALAVVHDAGFVHRDLKPGNIFLARDHNGAEVIKLLDFGIVRPADSDLTGAGGFLGTMDYMSPEQIKAWPLDGRADIYSFGVLLYRALAGHLPFCGEPAQLVFQHIHDIPPSLVGAGREIPASLAAIVAHCLCKSSDDRFQSMRDVQSSLLAVLQDATSPLAVRPGVWCDGATPDGVVVPRHDLPRAPHLPIGEYRSTDAEPLRPRGGLRTLLTSIDWSTDTFKRVEGGTIVLIFVFIASVDFLFNMIFASFLDFSVMSYVRMPIVVGILCRSEVARVAALISGLFAVLGSVPVVLLFPLLLATTPELTFEVFRAILNLGIGSFILIFFNSPKAQRWTSPQQALL